MLTKTKIILLIVACTISIVFLIGFIWYAKHNHSQKHEIINLIILHNNDIHGRFDQVSVNGSTCTNELAKSNLCFGGFARISNVLKSYRNQSIAYKDSPSVLYFFAGDMFTGTNWFSIYKDQISSELLNKLKPDAISLGNHEFDFGMDKLLSYINELTAPVVAANIDFSKSSKLNNSIIQKSVILNVKNFKIGVVGYLTTSTVYSNSAKKLIFTPEIDAINEEAAKLRKLGVSIIIALGHSGYEVDKSIALKCPDVDVVIGGHSHSFLASKKELSNRDIIETIEGPYPTRILQPSGKIVPVVQAYAFTKYLGYLQVKFYNGKLISANGSPILLDSSVEQDKSVLNVLEKYRPAINALSTIVGSTIVYMDGQRDNCRKTECVMGNLVADSIRSCGNKINLNTCMAIVNAGAIRGNLPRGNVSLSQLMEILPFNSSLVIAKITGEKLLSALSHSADFYGLDDGGFLQFSGIKVKYNMSQPLGKRVNDVKVMGICGMKTYVNLYKEDHYNVVMPSYLLNGGDSYDFRPFNSTKLHCTDYTALIDYVKEEGQLKYHIEERQTNWSPNEH